MDNEEDDNYSTDSSEARDRDAKKAIVEVVEEEDLPPIPEYTDEQMTKLMMFIQHITTAYDLTEDDIGISFMENVTNWLLNVTETILFVYFDCGFLCASPQVPASPVNSLTYFIREEPCFVFSVEDFHDEICFGTIHENVEETILILLNCIYAPRILKDERWDDNVKSNLFVGLHSFLAYLTDLNSKIGSMVVLYVPNEGHNLTVEEAVLDKPLVKRLETVIIYWISQIRLCLNDMENIVQNELACPQDEYDFWIYKYEVLSGIEEQIRHENIQHIVGILDKSQSLFIKQFKTLREELIKELQRSSSNADYLYLLVAPCSDLEDSALPIDVPQKLPNIIFLIRVISLNSEYYNNKKNTERLFSYLSNEIINFCKSKVDIHKILNGNPRFGIKICDMSIDCCLSYKLIFKRLLAQFTIEDFKKTWMFDENNIFNQINIFIQRLHDIMEICETIIVFGRVDESMTIPPLNFGCYNAQEFLVICRDVEMKFENGLKIIKNSSEMILNVHNRLWYHEISSFKIMIRSLEEVVENLLVNVFLNIDNIEEALDVLTAMFNFSKRKNLQTEYLRRVDAMWKMFEDEIIAANKEISRSDKEHLACLPANAGKSTIIYIRMKKCERLKELLTNAFYLPIVPAADEKLKMYAVTVENIVKRIDKYNNDWSNQINVQPNTYLSRHLINRSATHGGLLECNIDRNVLPMFEEAKYFEFMQISPPSTLTTVYAKSRKISTIYNKVINVVLLHNKILYSLSEKERLLFKEHIKVMEKKIGPGIFRLTYNDEVTDSYIMDCLKHLEELQNFVDIYKVINTVNVKMFEGISNDTILNLKLKSICTLDEFRNKLKESRNKSVKAIGVIYKKVIDYIFVVYEGFEANMNDFMAERWMDYVRKIDSLAEFAILSCSRNTLNGIYDLIYGKNNMSPEPVISINVHLKKRKIVFKPSLEEVSSTLQYIYQDIIKSVAIFPRLNDKFELPSTSEIRHFHQVVAVDKECQSVLSKINEVIEKNLEKISDYVDAWNLFRYVWEVDVEKFMEKYVNKGLGLKEFESSMSKYFDVSNQVLMQDTSTTITFATLNCSELKKSVLEHIAIWKKRYKETLCTATLKKLENLHNFLTSRISTLNERPGNIQDLENLLTLQKTSVAEIKMRETDMIEIVEYYKYLEKYDIDVPSTLVNNFKDMPKHWLWYNQKLKEIDENLFNTKEQFKMGLLTNAKSLRNDILTTIDTLEDELPVSADFTSTTGSNILAQLYSKLEDYEIAQDKINKEVKLYEMPEIVHNELKQIRNILDTMTKVWKIVENWENVRDKYETANFWDIIVEELEDTVVLLFKNINKMYEVYREKTNWEFLIVNRMRVEVFKKTLPLISDLKNKALKDRHWNQVKSLAQNNFDENSPDFNLKAIMDMNLQTFVEEIQDISNSATMELQIEVNINNIIDAWSTLKYDVVPYKDTSLKIQGVDNCLLAFEEHAVLISNMKSTKFVEPFQDIVNEWETKLSFVSEIIENILQVQKKWLYLDNIFQGEDIKREMKSEVQLFEEISIAFQHILKNMETMETAIEATHYKNPSILLNEINLLFEKLEVITRALEIYLETKRNIFPRFYFISNDDLLEILGNSKKPNLNQIHMKKLFDNLNKLELTQVFLTQKTFKWHALGMYAEDGEVVRFIQPVVLDGAVESYLNLIEKAMRISLKDLLIKTKMALKSTKLVNRDKWMLHHPGQLCLVTSGIYFTVDCVKCLNLCHILNDRKPLKSLKKKQKKLLTRLSEISRQTLQLQMRLKTNAIITIEIHSRDIIEKMYKSNCKDVSHFEWFSQLKYFWDKDIDDCLIRQTNTKFWYSYEYTGNSGRLVITPLTDRCYITLTTALNLFRGASLQGPAGTGKTETTKDLAKALGLWAVVFNCSDGLDYISIGKSFSGLCQGGFWGCFDEFNRINIEVLSVVAQQILSILTALSCHQKSFTFEGNQIRLVNTTGFFITMNPGYAGRTELPDNLKSMFRPISMMVPDNLIIAENLFFSDGFINAQILAKKVIVLYDLSKLQLSKQYHYDFGLRSMVALLRYAGRKKRENPTVSEEEIVYLAMRDMNLAKLTFDDLPLFISIMDDIFPTVKIPIIKNDEFINAIKSEVMKMKLQDIPISTAKVIQLYETKLSRHSVMLLGETNTAKSVTWKLLKGACCAMKLLNINLFESVQEYVINPKSVSLAELYGEYNLATGEWNDGILSSIMRRICADEAPSEKWLVFDGPVDAVWIENMNSVMDDNKLLTLINSERITMPKQVSLLFEVADLSVASPATISRCGMVYNDYKDWSWRPFINSWLSEKHVKVKNVLNELLDRYLNKILEFKEKNCVEIMETNELNLIMSFCKLWDCLATPENGMDVSNDDAVETMGKMWFFFCLIWSVCAVVDLEGRRKIDCFIREMEGIFPLKDTVFEYFIDPNKKTFLPWESQLEENWRHPENIMFYKIVVPTADTIRYGYILSNLLKKKHPTLLVGEVGTGKSSLAMSTLSKINPDTTTLLMINMSAQTTSNILQDAIESRTEKRTKNVYVPIGGKEMITFVDDFNMPVKDFYGSQPPLELLRQWIDYGFVYDRQKQNAKFIKNMLIMAAMGPVGGSRQAISPRTSSRFSILNIAVPSDSTTNQMFSLILTQHFEKFQSEVSNMVQNIMRATISLYNIVTKKMLPTPAKIHYLFNLRDVSKVIQGLVRSNPEYHVSSKIMLRLWVHESLRVFSDRLIDDTDQNWFSKQLNTELIAHFDSSLSSVCPGDSPLFGNFMNPHETYEDIKDSNLLREFFQSKLKDFNQVPTFVKMNLIFFRDAMCHLVRIIRVISQSGCHMLVVGLAGSGRLSLCNMATYITELILFQIKPTEKYKVVDFKEDLKSLYKSAGVKGKPTLFLLNDTQLKNELFFEIINNMLSTGEVTNLYKQDELEEHKQELKKLEPSLKNLNSYEETFSIIVERAKINLHIIISMSPIGEQFRSRVRNYPALINCTTIDWFCDWPEEAYLEVSSKYFNNLTLNVSIDDSEDAIPTDSKELEIKLRTNLSALTSFIHLSVIDTSKQMFAAGKRVTYITPSGFLEMVIGFDKMLEHKRSAISSIVFKFRNGLSKIDGARENVDILSKEMIVNKEKNEIYSKECEEYMVIITDQKLQADQEQKAVEIQKNVVIEQAAKVKVAKEQALVELAKVMPGLLAAMAALDTLNKKDLTEIKSYVTPPAKVEKVLEAVMILLERPPNWAESKRKLGEQTFLEDLKNLDKNNMQESTLRKLNKYVNDPEFAPEKVGAVSFAAKSLCEWVRAMKKYGENWKVVGPKQAEVQDLENKLIDMQNSLELSEKRLLDLANTLLKFSNDYNEKLIKKNELSKEAERLELKLERANILVESLGGERQRWIDTEKQLVVKFQLLLGDCLVATSFLCYLGPFTSQYREALLNKWSKEIRAMEIPISDEMIPTTFITDSATIRQWNIQGLPGDNFSSENGVLVTSASKWPILIDPQSQAYNWLRNMEGDDLKMTDFAASDFVKILESAIQLGKPVLIQNIAEEMPSILTPLLNKALIRQGSSWALDFNDKLINYNNQFRLYFTTRIANPNFPPETFTKTKVVNFSVKEEGLEDQLLGIIIKKERPSLEEQKNNLVVEISRNKKVLQELEDEILRMLNEDRGPVLEDDELFSTLQTSRKTSSIVKESLVSSEITENEIDLIREGYRPSAARASLLYFVLRDLSSIDSMYQFSLAFYIALFSVSIEQSTKHPNLKQRILNLNDFHTLSVYKNTCLSLFEKHKLMFSFFMTVRILESWGKLDIVQYEFLLKGGNVLDRKEQLPNPGSEWISEESWDNITELEKMPGFSGITDSFAKQGREWKEWFLTSEPENAHLPDEWEDVLNNFQKMLLVRGLRMDRMVSCLMAFVVRTLGQKYVEPPVLDLNSVFNKQSQSNIPLIFVLSSGVDPTASLIQLAQTMKLTSKFKSLSLGQGQAVVARNLIQQGIKYGHWIFLANCHLSLSWMPELEKTVEALQFTKVHPRFRLWLSSSPNPFFPISILQSSIKMTTEPPRGLKANLKRLYNLVTDDKFQACRAREKYKKLLFALTFFHAVLIERRKFEQLGWNTIYSFNDSDFDISENILSIYLDEYAETPWEALKFMIADINYGGHITDQLDKKLLVTYSNDMFNDNVLLLPNYKLSSSPLYFIPKDGTLQSYQDFLNNLPNIDHPVAFGQHQNANITSLIIESQTNFTNLMALQSDGEAEGDGDNREDKMYLLAQDLLSKKPKAIDYYETKKALGRNLSPLDIVLLQEIERYNKFLIQIESDLSLLLRCVKGLAVLTSGVEEVISALNTATVPRSWLKTYPSVKPLGSFVRDLLMRIEFFAKWAERCRPPTIFWLSGFSFPNAFLTSVLQKSARFQKVAIDDLSWEFIVMTEPDTSIREGPQEGVYVSGIFLESGSWNRERSCLQEPKILELICPMPTIHFKTSLNVKRKSKKIYECPTYYYPIRAARGPVISFVISIDLKTGDQTSSYWIKRGTALLLSLSN